MNPEFVDEQRRRLMDLEELLGSEESRLTTVVTKCLILAESLGLREYSTYFNLQLLGLNKNGSREARWLGRALLPEQSAWNPFVVFTEDRTPPSPQPTGIFAHSLRELELLDEEGDAIGVFAGAPPEHFLRRMEIKTLLARCRARAAQFAGELAHQLRTGVAPTRTQPSPRRIFVGHGNDPQWKELTSFLRDDLGLDYEEFNREPAAGKTTKERLDEMLDSSTAALLVLTGEDEHADGGTHARENVVHETGLFQGRLGWLRSIVLLEDDCAEFSNIRGLTQIRFPKGRIRDCFEDIRETLLREGLLSVAEAAR